MTYFPFPLLQDQHSYAQATRLPSKLFLDQLIYKRITNPVLFFTSVGKVILEYT